MVRKLDIFGAGQVGRALGKAWAESGAFELHRVCNRSLESAREAVQFIGSGEAVSNWGEAPADIIMISASDSAIGAAADVLVESNVITPTTIVFHTSGTQSVELLAPLRTKGASIGSLHPVKSFPDADSAARSLAGTCFTAEGDEQAIGVLRDAVQSIGGKLFRICPPAKSVYHAGSVFACSNLAATLAAGMECLRLSGLSAEDAALILRPIATETVDSFFARAAVPALTGPLVRGEVAIVQSQLNDLDAIDPLIADAYRALGRLLVRIAASQRKLPEEVSQRFMDVFAGSS